MKALIFEQFGGPEVLIYKEIPDPLIEGNQLLVRTKAIGLNFADVYRRKGNYHLAGSRRIFSVMKVQGSSKGCLLISLIFKLGTGSPLPTFHLLMLNWSPFLLIARFRCQRTFRTNKRLASCCKA